jgi:G:T/U-mismatch repair DNA glycosylase
MSNKCSVANKVFTRCFAQAKQARVDYLAKTKKVCIASLVQAKQQKSGTKLTTKQARIACSAKAKQIGTAYFVKTKQNHSGCFAKAIQILGFAPVAMAKLAGSTPRYANRDCVDGERIAPCRTAKDHDNSVLAPPLGTPLAEAPDTWRWLALPSAPSGSFWSNIHSMP